MARIRMLGDEELLSAHQRVGMIINAGSRLEEAVAYLQWQLTAFSWDKDNPQATASDRQLALRTERANWDKYAHLNDRLRLTTKAFDAQHVANVVSTDRKLKTLRSQWNTLSERARKLGEKRNLIGHTFLTWSSGKVFREIGRPWSERVEVSEKDDNDQISEIGALTTEIALYTTELGTLLPFSDDDQIITTV
ncbi:hypothetical protein [Bradyrhizobium sp. LMTR 3]|uniref:hypothetical protein n=1 Tax=Bradyrhizobium sp. LMTR 3 TaxID=189873 RepID=UPI00081090D9|nr:hypothetical protein [Bradyrhizobium sp. LMTR 3]OCK55434.1 hypothetical protein LMTR3_11510 [Bradyrhizobium sp. LMTR 3]